MSDSVVKKITVPEELLDLDTKDYTPDFDFSGPTCTSYERLLDKSEFFSKVLELQNDIQKRNDFLKARDLIIKKTKKTPYLLTDLDLFLNNSKFLRDIVANNCSFITFDAPDKAVERAMQMHKAIQFAGELAIYKHYKQKNKKRLKVARYTSTKKANEFASEIQKKIEEFKAQGCTTLESLTKKLNEEQIPTRSGKGKWHLNTVQRIFLRTNDLKLRH